MWIDTEITSIVLWDILCRTSSKKFVYCTRSSKHFDVIPHCISAKAQKTFKEALPTFQSSFSKIFCLPYHYFTLKTFQGSSERWGGIPWNFIMNCGVVLYAKKITRKKNHEEGHITDIRNLSKLPKRCLLYFSATCLYLNAQNNFPPRLECFHQKRGGQLFCTLRYCRGHVSSPLNYFVNILGRSR